MHLPLAGCLALEGYVLEQNLAKYLRRILGLKKPVNGALVLTSIRVSSVCPKTGKCSSRMLLKISSMASGDFPPAYITPAIAPALVPDMTFGLTPNFVHRLKEAGMGKPSRSATAQYHAHLVYGRIAGVRMPTPSCTLFQLRCWNTLRENTWRIELNAHLSAVKYLPPLENSGNPLGIAASTLIRIRQ